MLRGQWCSLWPAVLWRRASGGWLSRGPGWRTPSPTRWICSSWTWGTASIVSALILTSDILTYCRECGAWTQWQLCLCQTFTMTTRDLRPHSIAETRIITTVIFDTEDMSRYRDGASCINGLSAQEVWSLWSSQVYSHFTLSTYRSAIPVDTRREHFITQSP